MGKKKSKCMVCVSPKKPCIQVTNLGYLFSYFNNSVLSLPRTKEWCTPKTSFILIFLQQSWAQTMQHSEKHIRVSWLFKLFFFKEPSTEVSYPTFVTLLNLMIRSWQIYWSFILDFSSPDTFNLSLILLMERGKVNSILKASLTRGLFNITTCRQELASLTLYPL